MAPFQAFRFKVQQARCLCGGIVEAMRLDDLAELFDELPAGMVKRLSRQLSLEERQATATLLGYPEGTARRVMTTEYVRLRQGLTVGQALGKIRLPDFSLADFRCFADGIKMNS